MNKHNQNRIDFYDDVMSLLKQYNLTKDDLLEVFGCKSSPNMRKQINDVLKEWSKYFKTK